MAKRAAKKSGPKSKATRSGAPAPGRARVAGASGQGPEPAPFDGTEGLDPVTDDGAGGGGGGGAALVIVESPAKAKTINKYLGGSYRVLASVGHVRDLPSKNPKGVKSPVPGVDLERDFATSYQVLEGKDKVIGELKRTARKAREVYFATDPDREGEAIAWHLAEELGIKPGVAKRVTFNAITKAEVQRGLAAARPIDMDRVNAQQARRVLDRIVGYQVSPLLWKKVARGLSAGRVQSVAVRLIVDRERAIRAFIPDESYEITACFTGELAKAGPLAQSLAALLAQRDAKGNPPTQKELLAWLGENACFRAELVEVAGEKFELLTPGGAGYVPQHSERLAQRALQLAELAGLKRVTLQQRDDPQGKGPARVVRTIAGAIDPSTPYHVTALETKRTTTRPPPPFITSTLQQAAANRLGFGAQRTMGAAQQLYQGVEIPGEGPVALITYMRTDSTRLSGEAIAMAREFIPGAYGPEYLPEKPNFFGSSNKDAQDAHEAIRPTSMAYPPGPKLERALRPDLFKLYKMIWDRFIACQMKPAEWDSTAATIVGGTDPQTPLTFRATGRVLVFDGFYRVLGVFGGDEATLPPLRERQALVPVHAEARQKFTSPPPRFTEASLIKTLESEGIGRPSTYASIIGVIQDRKYVEQLERRFYSTDIGEVVTDMLVEAFPDLLDLGYTRDMEQQLDKVEEDHLDWVEMLRKFYGPFKKRLGEVEGVIKHAKAETTPAPFHCPKCEAARKAKGLGAAGTVYRLGKNGKFLSCDTYPECDYAAPVDREGKPKRIETTSVACHKCGRPMIARAGKFGPFLGCSGYSDKANPCDGILRLDKRGRAVPPTTPPYTPEPAIACPKCQGACYLRPGKYGPWLGCSKFPKCRGRGDFKKLAETEQSKLLAALDAHTKAHPAPVLRTLDGEALTGPDAKPLATAPRLDGKDDDGAPPADTSPRRGRAGKDREEPAATPDRAAGQSVEVLEPGIEV
jgi:DNA topoisomerase-1